MLGVILLQPPRLSETFIALELEALAGRGVPLRVFALATGNDSVFGDAPASAMRAGSDDDPAADDDSSVFTLPVISPPAGRWMRAWCLARTHLAVAAYRPRRYLRQLHRRVIGRSWARLVAAWRGETRMAWSHLHEFLLAGWLAEMARAHGIRHLHAHYATAPATVALMVHELTGLPLSFTAHAKDAYSASRRRLRKKIAASRLVVTCSQSVANHLRALAPEHAAGIRVIHHGVSPEITAASADTADTARDGSMDASRRRHGEARDTPLVLAAGRLVEKKGFDDLLRAIAILRTQGVACQAQIVGGGRLLDSLAALSRELGVGDQVRFLGPLPHAVLARLYRDAACFVMPSRVLPGGNRDGVPNVLLEAMAAGTPVVATAVGGIPEAVQHEENGLLVAEGDPRSLAAAIATVLADPQAAAARAQQARKMVDARFSLEHSTDELIAEFTRAGVLPESRPLRVGYVVKRYPRLSETFVLEEILEQERQGTQVHIVSLKKPDEGRFHADLARVRAAVSYLPGYVLPSLDAVAAANARWFVRRPGRYLGALILALRGGDRHTLSAFLKASLLADIVMSRRLELLHAHFATGATFMAMLVSRLTGVPYAFTAHARDLFGSHIDRKALRRKVEHAAYTVVVSDETQRFLVDLVGPELAPKVRRIYNGVHPALLRRPLRPLSGGMPLLLGVGRLVEKKGFVHLIAAAARLQELGFEFRLALAGDGPCRRQLENEAARSRVKVTFLGALPHDQVLRAMHGARAVVLPSIVAADGDRDVLPTVLLEAQALGRPVVATRLTGIPEIVEHEGTGLLVPADDPETLVTELVAALTRLLADRSLATRLGQAGRERMARQFDPAVNVAALGALMRIATGASPALAARPVPFRPARPASVPILTQEVVMS